MKNIFIALVFIILTSCSKQVNNPTFTTITGVTVKISNIEGVGLGKTTSSFYVIFLKDNTSVTVSVDESHSEKDVLNDFNKIKNIIQP